MVIELKTETVAPSFTSHVALIISLFVPDVASFSFFSLSNQKDIILPVAALAPKYLAYPIIIHRFRS
jgi:hypothetical protein